ncbi:hypothetical protein [Synoicihabitans lomoniglobus]|uniref:Uncharacterized protein n=1 Tax=Synoicihabitans lomoniglobus TaxID=2909285 RepID=A0AAE9ZUW6_9BACT|nr:hypothetical protein [Opitutaceae bacterium LMO-M01]WED63494.1 hypothetical protein PXH66_14230 [Opitutaceae bacterium LMO-M01]
MNYIFGRAVRCGVILVLMLLPTSAGLATSLRPITFPELATRAEDVVHARVTRVHAFADVYEGRPLVRTAVEFEVLASVDGVVRERGLTLRFLGGSVGNKTMRVDGMPTFRRGEEVVLFLHQGERQACPLVGWGNGRYNVVREPASGASYLTRDDGRVLPTIEAVDQRLRTGPQSERLDAEDGARVSLERFLAAVKTERERKARSE